MADRGVTSPRFTVKVNGEQRCIAGFDGYAVLSAGLSHVRRIGDVPEDNRALIEGAVRLHVGGLQDGQLVEWLTEPLFVGDEATIVFGEGGPIDPGRPIEARSCRTRSPEDASRAVEHRRQRLSRIGHVTPHRFEVIVNGGLLCTAGVKAGVISVHVTYTRRDPATKPPHQTGTTDAEWECGGTDLIVGGLENEVYVDWTRGWLDVGDEVTVRILGPGPIDPVAQVHDFRQIPHVEQAVVLGSRVSLRKLIDADVEFLADILRDEDGMRFCSGFPDSAGAQDWVRLQRQRYQDEGCGIWLAVDCDTHEHVGLAGVVMTDVEGERLPVLECVIHRGFRRQGYGGEAVWMCMGHVDRRFKMTAEYALVQPDNEPAMKLARKMGMTPLRNVHHAGCEHVLFERHVRVK